MGLKKRPAIARRPRGAQRRPGPASVEEPARAASSAVAAEDEGSARREDEDSDEDIGDDVDEASDLTDRYSYQALDDEPQGTEELAGIEEDDEEFESDDHASVEAYINGLEEPFDDIVRHVSGLIRGIAPGVREQIKWGMPHYSQNGHLVYVDAKRDHVNLGFYRGDELADVVSAKTLFLGAGGKLRHIQLFSVHSIPEDEVSALIRAAVELNQAALNRG